jgi:hypothetical protein
VSVATRTSKFLLNDPTRRGGSRGVSRWLVQGYDSEDKKCTPKLLLGFLAEPLAQMNHALACPNVGGRCDGGCPLRGVARGGRSPTTARQCPHNLLHKTRSNPECRLTPDFNALCQRQSGAKYQFCRLKSCYWRRRSPQEIVGRLSVAKESTVDEFRKRKALIQQGLTLEILVCEMSWPLTASSRTPLIRR